MYQQQGYANGPRSGLRPPLQNSPHPIPANMQPMGFQFTRPTQLPKELESALAIRSASDTDHRQLDRMHQLQQPQLRASGADTSQHESYGSHSTDHLPAHQQPTHWCNSGHTGGPVSNWATPTQDTTQSHPARLHIVREGQNFYTPESAGSILASFGLSNDDLEVLSHYPDDQLTPDTLPFILRDIQINKSGQPKLPVSSTSSTFSLGLQDLSFSPALSRSSELPSPLSVTQTPRKVIDYGHASRAQEEFTTGETFKREPLSSERTVKMYPVPSIPQEEKSGNREICLETLQQSKLEDMDLHRTSRDNHKDIPTPMKDFQPSLKSHKPPRHFTTTSESRSKTTSSSAPKRPPSSPSLSASSGSKPPSGRKKFPTPTMISDFSAVSPKVYPHTCSLCNVQCDQEKDWLQHVNTVKHTARCKHLRNSYPEWKPPRSPSDSKGHYGHRDSRDPSERPSSRHTDKSLSRSPGSSPPRSKSRPEPHTHRSDSKPYFTAHRHRLEPHHSGSYLPKHLERLPSSREQQLSNLDSPGHRALKRRHDERSTSSSTHGSKREQPQSHSKALKGVQKTPNASSKAPAAKRKKAAAPASKDSPLLDCLVFLMGIPKHASEQDVTNLVGTFGKINNVILMPCSEGDDGQTASVCMMAAEDARALAMSANLCIQEQRLTAAVAKKPAAEKSSDAVSSLSTSRSDRTTPESSSGAADTKASSEKGTMLITGLPGSGWSDGDIISLVQPFWTPSHIIMATQIHKALVPVSDKEVAQEMLKVHNFAPAKIKDSEIKLNLLNQCIDCSTPVSLFNLLMGAADPQSSTTVEWNSLLVIRNVPDTPLGYREVQRLIQRFGTVIRTLVLQSMVICEMATAAMALSVYKRFQAFPCIIQSNPLIFSRKPDPKPSTTHSKAIPTGTQCSQRKRAKVKSSPAAKEEKSESTLQEREKSPIKDKKMKMTQKLKEEDQKGTPTNIGSVKRRGLCVGQPSAAVTLPSDVWDTSEDLEAIALAKTVAEDVTAPVVESHKTPTVTEHFPVHAVSKTSSCQRRPKATEVKVSAAVLENITKSSREEAAPAAEEQKEALVEGKVSGNAETKLMKRPWTVLSENKRRESYVRKERDARERVRWEEERMIREKEERTRREAERKERSQRESGRRERKQRERECQGGPALQPEGSSLSSRRGNASDIKTEEEEEEEQFLFNMSDFVTVDEVGEVADISDCPSPTVAMETNTSDKDTSTLTHHAIKEEPNVEAAPRLVKGDGHQTSADNTNPPTAETSNALGLAAGENTAELPQAESTPEPTPCQQFVAGDQTEAEKCCPDPPQVTNDQPVASDGQSEGEHRVSQPVEEPKGGEPSRAASPGERPDEQQEHLTNPEAEPALGMDTSQQQQSPNTEDRKPQVQTEASTRATLPPFDPKQPVGLEYLVPKSGFFCRVCVRFFSSAKEAELNHCKTLKHYENLQKYLKKTRNVTPKTNPS